MMITRWKMPTNSGQTLEQAAAAWVRAEWEFRCGPNAYRAGTQDWLNKAERKLRRALTGFGDLEAAYAVLPETKTPKKE